MAKIPSLDRPGPLLPWWMTAIVTGQTTNARLPLSHLGMLPRGDIALSLADYAADTASTVDADPGSAKLRWNHATQDSATQLFLSDTDDDSEDHSSLWPTLAVGGRLYLHNPDDLDVWQWWAITAVTASSGYVKLAVTLTGSAGSFGDGDPVVVTVQQPDSGGAVDSVNGQTGVVSLALDDLSDVDASAPTDGYALTWSSSAGKWEPAAPSGGGGGGLTNWTEGVNSSSPNATVPVVYFTATVAATNVDAAIVAKGTGATVAQIADGTSAGGNKRGTRATDWQKIRNAAARVASGAESTIVGGVNCTSSGSSSISGGDTCTASGQSSVALGDTNTASQRGASAFGRSSSASGEYSFAAGYGNNASGGSSAAFGESTTANGTHSFAHGNWSSSKAIIGVYAHASYRFSATGDCQNRRFQLASDTTNATPEASTANNSTPGAGNQVVLENNSAYIVKGVTVARQNTTGDTKSWEWTAHIKRGANAASTAMVAAASISSIAADSGASAWSLAVTADTTNGCLRVEVTGEASKSIKWSTTATSCEVAG